MHRKWGSVRSVRSRRATIVSWVGALMGTARRRAGIGMGSGSGMGLVLAQRRREGSGGRCEGGRTAIVFGNCDAAIGMGSGSEMGLVLA
jgi:hypothetical protein